MTTESKPISPAEFTRRMREVAENQDIERRHVVADKLMADTLRSLGYEYGVNVFWHMAKWYT